LEGTSVSLSIASSPRATSKQTTSTRNHKPTNNNRLSTTTSPRKSNGTVIDTNIVTPSTSKTRSQTNQPSLHKDKNKGDKDKDARRPNVSSSASDIEGSFNADIDNVLSYDTNEFIALLLAKHGVSHPESQQSDSKPNEIDTDHVVSTSTEQHVAATKIQLWWRRVQVSRYFFTCVKFWQKQRLKQLLQHRKKNFDKSLKHSTDKVTKTGTRASTQGSTARKKVTKSSDNAESKPTHHKDDIKVKSAIKIQRWYRKLRKYQSRPLKSKPIVPLPQREIATLSESKPHSPDDKVKDLLSYLEEVEKEAQTIKPIPKQKLPNINTTVSMPRVADTEWKAKFVALEVEMDDKTKTIQLLEKALQEQKNKEREMISKRYILVNTNITLYFSQQQEKHKLAVQKKELEEVISRHLAFIDTLLKDKQALSSKCETLANEIKSLQKQHDEKVQYHYKIQLTSGS
jgi:hypothetical protein